MVGRRARAGWPVVLLAVVFVVFLVGLTGLFGRWQRRASNGMAGRDDPPPDSDWRAGGGGDGQGQPLPAGPTVLDDRRLEPLRQAIPRGRRGAQNNANRGLAHILLTGEPECPVQSQLKRVAHKNR